MTPNPGLVGRLVGSVLPDDSPGYECDVCDLSFDGDRLNCPACGGRIVER